MNTEFDPSLTPGTRVVLRNSGEEGKSEYGIVVYCWRNEEIRGNDCYVAFFGDSFPTGKPKEIPYVLRYAATSLVVISE